MKPKSKNLGNLKLIAFVALVLTGIATCFAIDFHLWKLAHPDAPKWVYFFQSNR